MAGVDGLWILHGVVTDSWNASKAWGELVTTPAMAGLRVTAVSVGRCDRSHGESMMAVDFDGTCIRSLARSRYETRVCNPSSIVTALNCVHLCIHPP